MAASPLASRGRRGRGRDPGPPRRAAAAAARLRGAPRRRGLRDDGVLLTGSGPWVYAGRPPSLTIVGQVAAYAGLIDLAATVLLALALAAACQAQRTALRALRLAGR